jgi:peptidoglycan hydrolase-like protein with peptidoglycan-binding domain
MPSRKSRQSQSHPNHIRRVARIGAGVAVAATSAGLLAAAPAAANSDAPNGLLTQGSDNPQVAQVQVALHLQASGRFGPKTRRAVRAFQHRDGLLVDGIVGVQTWDALFHIAPSPVSSSSTTPRTGAGYSSGGGYTIPSGIVQCESGGNYSAVNSSSGAGGAYQIMPSTWQAYGGQGLPQNASKAEQDRIAGAIYAHQGPGAWTC